MAGFLSNLITLGGAEQIEAAQDRIRQRIAAAERAEKADERSIQEGARAIQEFGVRYAELVQTLVDSRLYDSRLDDVRPMLPLGQSAGREGIEAPSEVGRVALSAAGGLVACEAVTAAVGAFGTASTGTAIAGLAGAAKTSATLAWLGGGSLAAGGGGMALGALTTAGLVALPLLGIGAFLSRQSARELEQDYRRMDAEFCEQSQTRARIVKPFVKRAAMAESLCAGFERVTAALGESRRELARCEGRRPTGGRSFRQWVRWVLWLLGRRRRRRLAEVVAQLEAELGQLLRQAGDLVEELRAAYCP